MARLTVCTRLLLLLACCRAVPGPEHTAINGTEHAAEYEEYLAEYAEYSGYGDGEEDGEYSQYSDADYESVYDSIRNEIPELLTQVPCDVTNTKKNYLSSSVFKNVYWLKKYICGRLSGSTGRTTSTTTCRARR